MNRHLLPLKPEVRSWCDTLHHYESRIIGAYDVSHGELRPVQIQQVSQNCVRCGAPRSQGGICPGKKP